MNDFLNILSKYAKTFMAPHDLYVYTGATNIEFLHLLTFKMPTYQQKNIKK
jgi:hypothetical protein